MWTNGRIAKLAITTTITDHRTKSDIGFCRIKKRILDIALVSCFRVMGVRFSSRKSSLSSQYTKLCVSSSEFKIDASSFLDMNHILIGQLLLQLLFWFKGLSYEILVVLGVSDEGLTTIALVEGKLDVSWSRYRDCKVEIFFHLQSKRKLMVEGQIYDLTVVYADRQYRVFTVFVLYIYAVVLPCRKVDQESWIYRLFLKLWLLRNHFDSIFIALILLVIQAEYLEPDVMKSLIVWSR